MSSKCTLFRQPLQAQAPWGTFPQSSAAVCTESQQEKQKLTSQLQWHNIVKTAQTVIIFNMSQAITLCISIQFSKPNAERQRSFYLILKPLKQIDAVLI